MEKSLVLASNNKGKLREFQAIFAELGVDVINQGALVLVEEMLLLIIRLM